MARGRAQWVSPTRNTLKPARSWKRLHFIKSNGFRRRNILGDRMQRRQIIIIAIAAAVVGGLYYAPLPSRGSIDYGPTYHYDYGDPPKK